MFKLQVRFYLLSFPRFGSSVYSAAESQTHQGVFLKTKYLVFVNSDDGIWISFTLILTLILAFL